MDILTRIRQAAWRGAIRFTLKAREEMHADDLTREDVRESLVFATRIAKVIRSRSPWGDARGEKLYVIKSRTLAGTPIFTKGTFRKEGEDVEFFYVLISSKLAT